LDLMVRKSWEGMETKQTWDEEGYPYKPLYWSLDFPEEFLLDLQDRLYRQYKKLLGIFKDPLDCFLVKIPLQLERYMDTMINGIFASLVANYFVHQVQTGERINDYAEIYDNEHSPTLTHHL
jgi:hypothetical protein